MVVSLVPALVGEGVLRCPRCRGGLSMETDSARCPACARAYAFANGALDLYGARGESARARPDPAFVREVASALRLPATPEILARTAQAVSGTLATSDDPHHSAEIADLADRLGIAMAAPGAPARASASPASAPPVIEWGVNFIEEAMPAGIELLRSVRIRNAGTATIATAAGSPLYLAYHWRAASGKMVTFDGERTALPVPLAPGRELTVIARIVTPSEPGDYRLEFQFVLEGERWIDPPSPEMRVGISRSVAPALPLGDTGQVLDYGADHHVAAELVFAKVRERWPERKLRVLEVGGGIHPSMAGLARFGHTVTALDISFPMSQLGQLCASQAPGDGGAFAFVACDATDPPVAGGAFDFAAVFAAVHHFPRPDRLLAALRRTVRPGGFIAVMCEPCLPDPSGPDYLRDLAKGINEQAWSLPEWARIFARAGLRATGGQVDHGSLKAFLEEHPEGEL